MEEDLWVSADECFLVFACGDCWVVAGVVRIGMDVLGGRNGDMFRLKRKFRSKCRAEFTGLLSRHVLALDSEPRQQLPAARDKSKQRQRRRAKYQ